jgi:hypothetical protein
MTKENYYLNDSPEEAARKASKEGPWFVVPENGKSKQKVHFVQKYSKSGLLAEAVIVGGTPYFAVSKLVSGKVKVTLEDSIPIGDKNEYRPPEESAYLNKPYKFESMREFNSYIDKAIDENLQPI